MNALTTEPKAALADQILLQRAIWPAEKTTAVRQAIAAQIAERPRANEAEQWAAFVIAAYPQRAYENTSDLTLYGQLVIDEIARVPPCLASIQVTYHICTSRLAWQSSLGSL